MKHAWHIVAIEHHDADRRPVEHLVDDAHNKRRLPVRGMSAVSGRAKCQLELTRPASSAIIGRALGREKRLCSTFIFAQLTYEWYFARFERCAALCPCSCC